MIPERLSICKTIAERMKLSRRKERITQKQLAEKIGVAEISIKRWENADTERVPNVLIIKEIADALNTSVAFLIGEVDGCSIKDEQEIFFSHKQESMKQHNFSYWGEVVDNICELAQSGNAQETSLIYMLLKSGFEKLEKARINRSNDNHNNPHVDIQQNNFGRDATVNVNSIQTGTVA